MVGYNRLNRRRAAAQQAFVHGIQDIAVIRFDRPREQTTQVFVQHVFAFRIDGTGIIVCHQLAGGFVEHVRRFCRFVVFVFPAWFAQHLVYNLTVVNNTVFPCPFDWTRRGTGEWIVTRVTVNAGPAAAIHARTDDNLARLNALRQHLFHCVIGGVVGIWFPGSTVQRGLVTQIGITPRTVEVVAHQEDMVDVLLRGVVVHVFDLIFTCTDCRGQLVGTASFRRQLVQHLTQVMHQRGVSRFIGLRVTQLSVLTAAAREFPVDIHTVEYFPGGQEVFNGRNEAVAQHFVIHLIERVRQRPAAYGWQDFQIGMGFFHRHQLAVVAFVRVVPVAYALLRLLQRSPRVVDRHGVVLAALTGAFQRLQRAGGFGAVVNTVAATDWNEAVQQVVNVRDRNFVCREVTVVHAPLREVSANHFIGVLRERFVVFQQRGVQRKQVATVGIRHDDQLAGALGAAAVVTQLNLLLIASAFLHFKGRRACGTARTGPDGLAVQQHFCRRWGIAAPDVPLHLHVNAIFMHFDEVVVVLCRLIHLDQRKPIVA